MNNLIKLLQVEGREINHFFEKASLEGEGTPQEVSDRRESALTAFLRKYFPFPYRIAKGNIRDSYGNSSMSIDCILLNPTHPFTTTDEVKYSIILADGVDAAIELKPHLNSDSEISRSLHQIISVKNLKRKKSGLLNIFNEHSSKFEENCKRIPSVIFATETYVNEVLLLEKIVAFYEKNNTPRELQFDIIVINQKFLILNCRRDSYIDLKIAELGTFVEEGLIIYEYGDLTLSAFLLYLNKFPQSESRISSTVLEHYLNIKPERARTYRSLNTRLIKL